MRFFQEYQRNPAAEKRIAPTGVKIVENILAILDENLYDNINLDTIAEKLSFSKTYIKSVFKKRKIYYDSQI